MAWWDFHKIWSGSFVKGPLQSRKLDNTQLTGAGFASPESMPDLRGETWGSTTGGSVRLVDSNDMVDLTSVVNRLSRYKEYERLRNVAEIEMAMTVIADEACVSGYTKIATAFDGYRTIQWLTERWNQEHKPFLVYCWDFEKNNYTLGWAYDARLVHEKAECVKVQLGDGSQLIVTPDHRILTREGEWVQAGDLKCGDKLMPYYRLEANRELNDLRHGQFPRIYTPHAWKTERQFIDEWKGEGKPIHESVNEAVKLVSQGYSNAEVAKIMKTDWRYIENKLRNTGFTPEEIRWLGGKNDYKRVVGVMKQHNPCPVYDLSVDKHENFCTDSVIMHNCQRGENEHVFKIRCSNEEVQKELEFLCFNRKMLNFDRRIWQMTKRLCIFGDGFYELITDPEDPKQGVLKIQELPPDTMFKIVTSKNKLVEYQQSKDGPDYVALTKTNVLNAPEAELQQSTAIRFAPKQIVHMWMGDDRRTFYPYGQSLIEPARGPAHQLRLMEDSMIVYRLCLTGETRVMTDNGWKYIKDISINDNIFSYSPFHRELYPSKVINWKNNGKQQTYSVKSKHIEIVGNATHPIWVERDGTRKYVLIKDLIPKKDKLLTIQREEAIPTRIPTIFGEKWAKLSKNQRNIFRDTEYDNISALMRECEAKPNRTKQFLYAEGKALPLDQAIEICDKFDLDSSKLKIVNKGQVNSERINVPEFVDEDFARLFGFLIGDGSTTKYQVRFSAGLDKKLNQQYECLLEKYFGRVDFEPDNRSTKNLGSYTVSSIIASKIFSEMGYIPGAKNKRIPAWVFTAPKNIRKAFVEGISDADGTERLTKSGTWFSTIELCNKDLIADIKEIWSSIGLCSGKLGERNRKGGHEIESGRRIKPTRSYSVTLSELPLPELETIYSVTKDKIQDVFDITVDNEDCNFIANCTIVHNTRAPERKVFYIDVSEMPPFKVEAFMDRIKDKFRKKKVTAGPGGQGASAVEERWHAPAADEDYWLPIRPGVNTRIESLPGAQNLGEIDDALYFRNKLFTALNFPRNYFSSEDVATTRITLSANDVKFARMIERIQAHVSDGIMEICETHLQMRGFPEDAYEDLAIEMTPPSAWKELSEAEVWTNRINLITSIKSALFMADYDLLTRFMKVSDEEAEGIISRNKIQKLEELQLQIIGQNPQLLGMGTPGQPNGEAEMGTDAGGPNPMLGPDGAKPPEGEEPPEGVAPPEPPTGGPGSDGKPKGGGKGMTLPEPEDEDIKKYDLELQDYSRDMDREEIDWASA